MVDVAQVGCPCGRSRQWTVPPTAGLRIDDERRIIRQFSPEPLRAGNFWRPAGVVQPCEAKVVQPCRSQPGASKLPANHLAAIGEESLNPISILLFVRPAGTSTAARK